MVLGHGRQELLWFEVMRRPTGEWLARQITEAFPWDEAPGFLVYNNDRAYGQVFAARLRAMGIRDRHIAPRSPWQNGHAERLIGSIRRECLDHHLVIGAGHLHRILAACSEYYNRVRPHLALGKDALCGRPVQARGEIVAMPVLSGLHHQYLRI